MPEQLSARFIRLRRTRRWGRLHPLTNLALQRRVHDMLEVRGCGFKSELHALGYKETILGGQSTIALEAWRYGYIVEARLNVQRG